MNKIGIFIMVFGLVLLSPIHMEAAFCDSFSSENTFVLLSPDISIVVPSDSTSVYVIYIETADISSPVPVSTCAMGNIATQLPDTSTIILLGFGGLLYRRRGK
jgi:hypothetical protein